DEKRRLIPLLISTGLKHCSYRIYNIKSLNLVSNKDRYSQFQYIYDLLGKIMECSMREYLMILLNLWYRVSENCGICMGYI
ncbi:MAG: hypothetical protein ACE5KZ_16200, partial [Candidatus Scalinduaceae bacterium]